MKTVVFHSHKGGVGKSIISVNLAMFLAQTGNNIVLVDFDFSGPSLQTYFPRSRKYFNEYLTNRAELSECMNQFSHNSLKGKFHYILADSSSNALSEFVKIDRKMATTMLREILKMKSKLSSEFNIDYLIIDTSPGISLAAVNSFIVADTIIFVNKLSNADIEGSAKMLEGILDHLDKETYLIANQIPPGKIANTSSQEELIALIQKTVDTQLQSEGLIEVLGLLPQDFDLQLYEFELARKIMESEENQNTEERTPRIIYVLDQPDHQFTKQIRHISSFL